MTNAPAPRGKQSVDFTGVAPLPLTGDRRSAFEGYLSQAITRFGIPGAAVAIIQGSEVAYLRGLGVKKLGGTQPVTPDHTGDDTFRPGRAGRRHRTEWHARGLRGEPGGDLGAQGGGS